LVFFGLAHDFFTPSVADARVCVTVIRSAR
jgi:hypothetical protein